MELFSTALLADGKQSLILPVFSEWLGVRQNSREILARKKGPRR